MSAPFSVRDLIAYEHNGISYIIRPTGDGDLSCTTCDFSTWCEHVQGCIQTGQDKEEVWRRVERPNANLLQIPLIPTMGIRSLVGMDTFNEDTVKVVVLGWMGRFEAYGLTEFLGFLNRGESRIHVRQMIINWFEPAIDLNKLRCESPNHNWRTQARLHMDFTSSAALQGVVFVHAWRMVFHKKCSYCYDEPDASDLIPD